MTTIQQHNKEKYATVAAGKETLFLMPAHMYAVFNPERQESDIEELAQQRKTLSFTANDDSVYYSYDLIKAGEPLVGLPEIIATLDKLSWSDEEILDWLYTKQGKLAPIHQLHRGESDEALALAQQAK